MRIRILSLIWCGWGSGSDFSPWCGSRSIFQIKTQNSWKSSQIGSYSIHYGLPSANWCGSWSSSSLWCGSGCRFLIDADPDPDICLMRMRIRVPKMNPDPCGSGSGSTTLLTTELTLGSFGCSTSPGNPILLRPSGPTTSNSQVTNFFVVSVSYLELPYPT